MSLFGGNTEPGGEAFHVCPECGMDKIYSQSEGFLAGTSYLCDNCGYEGEKHEVKKTFAETLDEVKKKRGIKDPNENISNPELGQQVDDRQAEGWVIEEVTDSGTRVVMSSTEGGTIGGHALTGALTGLWTFGMGNIAYNKLSKKKNRERIVLRAGTDSNSSERGEDTKNPTELIRELGQLNEEGLITDAEFEKKKHQLLDDL